MKVLLRFLYLAALLPVTLVLVTADYVVSGKSWLASWKEFWDGFSWTGNWNR